jgi:two-component system, OmpR family, response regulator
MMQALIIDDETDICFLLAKILRSKNIQTSYVNSIAAARQALKIHHPQIIFLDNHLPDGRGVDFLEDVKKESPQSKVIMITAYDNFSDREKAISNGADMFIPKPFSKEIIYRELEKLEA